MGGADSEVSDGDDRGAARGRELRADRDPADLGAARPAHRGVEPLGEGRRPAPRRARRGPREPPDRRSRRRRARRERRRPRRACPSGPSIRLRPERTDRIVGLEVEPAEQRGILERLGFDVSDDWDVTVPTWRARDVTREIDLVEEVARVVLDRVPHTMPLRRSVAGHLTREQRHAAPRRGRARRRRIQRGVHVEPRRGRSRSRARSGSPTR